MKRFFRILQNEGEGEGEGELAPLTKASTLIGRSRHADLQIQGDDLLISRRHLEVRIDADADAVFVKNLSSQGSSLNGKPLSGVVSLTAGDIIEIGKTRLKYEEEPDEQLQVCSEPVDLQPATCNLQPATGDDTVADPPHQTVAALDATRVASHTSVAGATRAAHHDNDEPILDATRAIADDATRALVGKELPGWKAPEQKKAAPGKAAWISMTLATVVLVGGAAWWFLRTDKATADSVLQVKDMAVGYTLDYPSAWSKLTDSGELVTVGVGKEGTPDWARVSVRADKSPEYAQTGLTYGFTQYQESLRKRYKDFELIGKKPFKIGQTRTICFGFSTPTLKGIGIYVLNAESRMVIECYCPAGSYSDYQSVFTEEVLQSFRLTTSGSQQVVDFALPTSAMQQLALANPAQLARQIEEHTRRGEALLASPGVKPDNLFQAVQEYRHVLQLAIAGPQRSPAYSGAARSLQQAMQLLDQSIERQRFEIHHALKERDNVVAYFAAHKMMQMVPEKNHPAFQEAYKITRTVELPKGMNR